MSVKVFISPNYQGVPAEADNGGIRRVVEAEVRHLAKYDVEVVNDPKRADVLQYHVDIPRTPDGKLKGYAPGKPIVHSGHGLMWSRYAWGDGMQEVNRNVTEAMAWAVAHTAPSEWVANAIRRGGLWYPEVIYHGVDFCDFEVTDAPGDYVLWNKARSDYVSDPNDMQTLARAMGNRKFLTTIGKQTANVRLIGKLPHQEMKNTIARAGVYLATARETFGIGTLEAMACGVPVAGWDWGGQAEIIVQGETGYLAPPGDYPSLVACVNKCFNERHRLGTNARLDVETRWRWEPRIEQYANLFRRLHEKYNQTPRPAVSVIVTTYQLDKYLRQCLDSVLGQSFKDWECLVIDDANSNMTWKIVEQYENRDRRFRYIATPHNLGLPGARNFGFNYAQGRYIRHLDADDFLAVDDLRLLSNALDTQPGMHIVYGHLEVVNEDGSRNRGKDGEVERSGWPPEQYDWLGQMAHLNQIPSCVMARREVFERSGGYRGRMKRNEDAEFWCRVTSLGFRAQKITQAVTYYHRMREDSKGAVEWKTQGAEPDWTAWFPWRAGASNYQDAVRVLRKHNGKHPAPLLVPFGAQGQAPDRLFWHVHDYAYPVVSVIITVGPGHERFLQDALDSVQAQSFPDWEVIVVNDTGKPWERFIAGAPYASVVSTGKNAGAAAARNAGFQHARGQYIVWMDGDDFWLPWFLERMVAHTERNDGVIFSDMFLWKQEDGLLERYRFQEFNEDALSNTFKYAGSSVLYPRKIVEHVFSKYGGWDIEIPGMEDLDWQIAVHSLGYCAYRVDEPLFVYRMWSTTKREKDHGAGDQIAVYLNRKWREYRQEGRTFMCGCNSNRRTNSTPTGLLRSSGDFTQEQITEIVASSEQMVRIEYLGQTSEKIHLQSRVLRGKMYVFSPTRREETVFGADAEWLLGMMDGNRQKFRKVPSAKEMEALDAASALGMGIAAR